MCSIDGPAMQAASNTTPANGASESPKEYWIVVDKFGDGHEPVPSLEVARAAVTVNDAKYPNLGPHRILRAVEIEPFAPVEAAA